VEVSARVTSKGQITIPRSVRRALQLNEGDAVVFRVEGDRAVLARTPDLLDLAGSIDVPAEVNGMSWPNIRSEAYRREWLAKDRRSR
jgi:AbrB family looped-hinge helix DNA binding protein